MAGKNKTLLFPECVWVVHTLVSLRLKNLFARYFPALETQSALYKGAGSNLQGDLPGSQRPGEGSRLPPSCIAWEASLGWPLRSAQIVNWKQSGLKRKFLTRWETWKLWSDKGPDPLFLPWYKIKGQSTLPKATKKMCNIPSNDFQYLKLQKSLSFLLSPSELFTRTPNS